MGYSVIECYTWTFLQHREIFHQIYFISWIWDGGNLFWPPKRTFYEMQSDLIWTEILLNWKMVRYTVRKCYWRPLFFAQMWPQNVWNAALETQNSKHFQGVMPPDPPTNVSSLYCEGTWAPPRLKWQGP